MLYFAGYFISPRQALQFTAQFLNGLRFQQNWLSVILQYLVWQPLFNVCNQTHRILEKPSARVASPHWIFSPTFIVSSSESILSRSSSIIRKGVFVLKNTTILWWLINAWWNQKLYVPGSWWWLLLFYCL